MEGYVFERVERDGFIPENEVETEVPYTPAEIARYLTKHLVARLCSYGEVKASELKVVNIDRVSVVFRKRSFMTIMDAEMSLDLSDMLNPLIRVKTRSGSYAGFQIAVEDIKSVKYIETDSYWGSGYFSVRVARGAEYKIDFSL